MNNQEHITFTTPKGTQLPIRLIRGKPYMDCAYRVVWFREEKPTWKIHTFMVTATDKSVLFRAAILNDANETIASAHKFQKSSFDNFYEKAESQAVGRALALCGYGTAHAHADFDDDSNEPSNLPDSPTAPIGWHPPEETQNDTADPTKFIVQFGKYKGQSLWAVGLDNAKNYANFLLGAAEKDGKPLSKNASEFVNAVDQWDRSEPKDISL